MSFDGIFTRAVVRELSSLLKGGRITKIHQPVNNEVILLVRAGGQNHKLLLSAHPNYARVHITNETQENPSEPPMFCMVLRKHLEGGFLENIYQSGMDRIIIFEVKGRNELGDATYKHLIVEIMGKHSNIILVDKEKGTIIDSVKHVSHAVNTYRAVMPGFEYIPPPQQNKLDPFQAGEEDVLRKLDFNSGKLDKQLVANFAGISPLFAGEVVFRTGLANRITLPKTFVELMNRIRKDEIEPALTLGKNKEAFYLFPLAHLQGEIKTFPTLSSLLDRFYFGKADRDRVKQQAKDLERFIINEKTKNEKKIKKLHETLEEAKNADYYRLCGELLTASLYKLKKEMQEVAVDNYYDGTVMTIRLDPQKSPSENSQWYFSKYQKLKNAAVIIKEQLLKTKEELSYFEALEQQFETASLEDIGEIREELIEGGYLRERRKKVKRKKDTKPRLDRYKSSDGTEILVGKNNKQNDYLTNKLASRDEWWLHTKDIPGSHVVIRSKEPSRETILEAAQLAAYFSKGRSSSSVPVDFTRIRHVKKPSGAKPGFVIYENQQTVYVTPDEETVIKLKN